MNAARRRVDLTVTPEALADLGDVAMEAMGEIQRTLDAIEARPKDGEPKAGTLTGAYSRDFYPEDEAERPTGRVIYAVRGREVLVFAIHSDHDEAYRRARKRAKRYIS